MNIPIDLCRYRWVWGILRVALAALDQPLISNSLYVNRPRCLVHWGLFNATRPTSLATLLKFAKLCGVKTSLLGLRHQSARLGQLLTVQTPDYLVDGLSDGPKGPVSDHRIHHFHLYTFGGVARSRDWLATRLSQEAIPA